LGRSNEAATVGSMRKTAARQQQQQELYMVRAVMLLIETMIVMEVLNRWW